jgi:hypothetical protein
MTYSTTACTAIGIVCAKKQDSSVVLDVVVYRLLPSNGWLL